IKKENLFMSLFKKLGLLSTSALLLAACGNEEADSSADTANESNRETSSQEDFHFEIASHTTPMVDIVELVTEELEAQDGYTADLLTVNDNIQYNEAVLNDEAFASFAQHEPFMELFNEERDGDLVAIQPVYNAIVGY